MSWEAVGALAELVGAAVVVASLVYLGIQVRQTNLQSEASAQSDWMSGWNDAIRGWSADDRTIEAMRTGFSDFDAMSPSQQAVFHMQLAALTNQWALCAELRERGLVPTSVFDGCTDVVVSVHSTPGGRTFLERNASTTPRGPELLEMVAAGKRSLPPITQVFPWWGLGDGSAGSAPPSGAV